MKNAGFHLDASLSILHKPCLIKMSAYKVTIVILVGVTEAIWVSARRFSHGKACVLSSFQWIAGEPMRKFLHCALARGWGWGASSPSVIPIRLGQNWKRQGYWGQVIPITKQEVGCHLVPPTQPQLNKQQQQKKKLLGHQSKKAGLLMSGFWLRGKK